MIPKYIEQFKNAKTELEAFFRAKQAAIDARQIEVVQGLVIDLRAGA